MFKATPKITWTPRKKAETAPKKDSKPLDNLPGELRNAIFQYCIVNALKKHKTHGSNDPLPDGTFRIAVQPRWQGRSKLCMEGLGVLPLLFVSKKFYKELTSLIYPMAQQVSIGGYILQHPSEDPSARWTNAYSRLEKHPIIQEYTKNVRVTLPHVRTDLFRGQWISMNIRDPEREAQANTLAVLSGLEVFLRGFTALETLKIVVIVVGAEVPDLTSLLPLYDLCGKSTVVEFREPHPSGDNVFFMAGWVRNWKTAWEECLFVNDRT